jgi:hypothetical protein
VEVAVTRHRIVGDRSEVRIHATSNVHPIHHRARGLEGFVDIARGHDGTVDPDGAAGEIGFAVDRLVAGNPLETRELRRRIDARHHPEITGRLHELLPTAEPDVYLARGEVTFRGVTRPAEDELRITALDADGLRIEGEHEFDIRDFGMEPPRVLVLRVDPLVRVRLTVELAPVA